MESKKQVMRKSASTKTGIDKVGSRKKLEIRGDQETM